MGRDLLGEKGDKMSKFGQISGPWEGHNEGFAILYADGSCHKYPDLHAEKPSPDYLDQLKSAGLRPLAVIRVKSRPEHLQAWLEGLPAQ